MSVTSEQVKVIIETSLDNIDPFIETARLIVTEQLSNQGLSQDRLDKIELFLSAHFVTLREKQLSSTEYGDATDEYVDLDIGKSLNSSSYGQTAVLLDTSNILAGTSTDGDAVPIISTLTLL